MNRKWAQTVITSGLKVSIGVASSFRRSRRDHPSPSLRQPTRGGRARQLLVDEQGARIMRTRRLGPEWSAERWPGRFRIRQRIINRLLRFSERPRWPIAVAAKSKKLRFTKNIN